MLFPLRRHPRPDLVQEPLPERFTSLNRAAAYDSLGRLDEAMADDNQSLALKPADPVTLVNRGVIFEKKKQHDLALADYNQAISLKADDPVYYDNRGIVYTETARQVAYFVENAQPLVEEMQAAGASVLSRTEAGEWTTRVLQDPAGNEFCVIGPD